MSERNDALSGKLTFYSPINFNIMLTLHKYVIPPKLFCLFLDQEKMDLLCITCIRNSQLTSTITCKNKMAQVNFK